MTEAEVKRGAPRFRILPLHNLACQIHRPLRKRLEIANLSISGMGVMLNPVDRPNFKVGAEISGELVLLEDRYPFVAEIVHHSGDITGVRYVENLKALNYTIDRYFELESQAVIMKEVRDAPQYVNEKKGVPRWFSGGQNCELYYVMKDESLVHFRISFFGNRVEWTRDGSLELGEWLEQEGVLKKWTKEEKPLLDRIVRFVSNIQQVPTEHFRLIESIIRMRDANIGI